MEERQRHFLNAKTVIGITIIIIGVLALLHNFGVDLKANVWDYWPLILILIGFAVFTTTQRKQTVF